MAGQPYIEKTYRPPTGLVDKYTAGEIKRLRAVISYLVKEHGEANEDWTTASIRIPDEVIVMDRPENLEVLYEPTTMHQVLVVKLDQPPEGGQEAPPDAKGKSVCKHCRVVIWMPSNSFDWRHEGSGKNRCAGGYGCVAEPITDLPASPIAPLPLEGRCKYCAARICRPAEYRRWVHRISSNQACKDGLHKARPIL